MARLATLDPAGEALLQSLERDSGAWLLAYAPAAPAEEPPAFARRLTPAALDEHTLARLQHVERRTQSVIVAYRPVAAD
jgi:hypothetical protein